MKKSIIALSLVLIFLLASCEQTDVVGKSAISSFSVLLNTIPDEVTEDEMYGGWSLSAPDGSARFFWSKNFNNDAEYDVMIRFVAQPFIDAGLDVDKLPDGMYYDGKITVGTNLGEDDLTYKDKATPLASFEKIVELKRESVKYHASLDHYGVDLAGGNMFEWAKDMSTNDKDIVFVLNPEVFIDAGMDPNSVEGWVFAKVSVMDEDQKSVELDKLLKPFNLK
ncbi:MAG TPA: hypothetical protein DCP51_08210 [Clostridiales bacterium]|nr:hypothetical protein [Clostridiales bacterium]